MHTLRLPAGRGGQHPQHVVEPRPQAMKPVIGEARAMTGEPRGRRAADPHGTRQPLLDVPLRREATLPGGQIIQRHISDSTCLCDTPARVTLAISVTESVSGPWQEEGRQADAAHDSSISGLVDVHPKVIASGRMTMLRTSAHRVGPTDHMRASRRSRSRGPRWLGAAGGLLGMLVAAGCTPDTTPITGSGEGGAAWLSGPVDERFQAVGDQFGGFSQTMLEVGLRYTDLHWAIEDGNRDYARYQAEKIGDAIERGAVRRPGREASSRALFLDGPLPALMEAIDSGEDERIRASFSSLTDACNRCHVAEQMGFLVVGPPEVRVTTLQRP
jgi:hypothetical protein